MSAIQVMRACTQKKVSWPAWEGTCCTVALITYTHAYLCDLKGSDGKVLHYLLKRGREKWRIYGGYLYQIKTSSFSHRNPCLAHSPSGPI